MTFLPIVERELRLAARRPVTHWNRFFAALAAAAIWLILTMSLGRSRFPGQRAHVLFLAVGIVALGFCLLAGVFLTADCLSEEKREGTLGLLFLTDLKGYDIVLGKLAATSVPALYGLLGILPVLALPLLMGGVSLAQFERVVLALLVTLFLSLSSGLAVSAFSRETRQALAGTFLAILVFGALLPVMRWLLVVVSGTRGLDWLFWSSPVYAYQMAFDNYYHFGGGASQYWASVLLLLLLAAGTLIVACVFLPQTWREKSRRSSTVAESRGWQQIRYGERSDSRRRELLAVNPFLSLASRDRLPQVLALAVVGSLMPVWMCFLAGCFIRSGKVQDISFTVVLLLGYGLHQVLKWLIAAEATKRFGDDRRSGALELLLVTPLSVEEILAGQRLALRKSHRHAIVLALIINVALVGMINSPKPMSVDAEARGLFTLMGLGGAVLLILDFRALCWTGMWMGLCRARHHRAILGTLMRIQTAPWLALGFYLFMAISGILFQGGEVKGMIMFWFLVGIVNDLVAGEHSRSRLMREFRRVTASDGSAVRSVSRSQVSAGATGE